MTAGTGRHTTPGDDALRDTVAVVTGAARGVGRATVAWLHTRGVQVLAEDIRPEVENLTTEFDGVATLVGDVSREETALRAVALARKRFGGLDILVNNAGRTLNRPFTETTAEDWDALMAVNARGAFLHAREAFRTMRENGRGGAIVNVGSYTCTVGLPEGSAYTASKGALAQLTKVIALEGGPHNIRANVVAPGVIETDLLDNIRDDSRAYLRSFAAAHPLGRVAQPAEIAEIIGFLASTRSSFMTGAVVAADGGFTAA
ncbi:SDR family oxidoreductase [Streptomyces sp. NPDC000151]|uniref:SDR family NAD(P)-dependent oxidoreductase n=1 Tax=Streptomyces sp. NPDC000151 TaxID=3154244 RepID=UPI00332A09D6